MQDKWNVDYTDEFGNWWEDQSVDVQEKLYKVVSLLEIHGPTLGFPYSSDIKGASIAMRELRAQCDGHPTEFCMCSTRTVQQSYSSAEIRQGMRIGTKEWFRLPRKSTRSI